MKNSLFISGLLFLVYLGLVSFQGGTAQYIVQCRTPGMPPLDGRSADLIDQVNRFQLDGVSPDQNVVAGLYEVAKLGELRYHDSTHVEITTQENALGIQIPMDPKTIISLGQKIDWLGEDIVLSNEDPILRRYLARHQRTLDQIATIVDRQHYANYYYSDEPNFVAVHLPLAQANREYARILNLRARVALGEDRISDAITDASSIYRLGGHMASAGATVVEALVGAALIKEFMKTWSEILSHPDLTVDDLERISTLVKAVPPITSAKGLDIGDRLAAHQIASYLEKYGSAGIQRIEPSARDDVQRSDPLLAFADWREIHQRIDQKVNEALDVLSASDEQERRTKIREMFARPENKFSFRKDFSLFNVPALVTDFTWKIIDDLWLQITPYNLKAMELARDQQEVLRVCIELKRFHFEKQRYPASLDELLGKYLDHIPLDYGTGEPIRYLRLKAGALVYTVVHPVARRAGGDHGGGGVGVGRPGLEGQQRDHRAHVIGTRVAVEEGRAAHHPYRGGSVHRRRQPGHRLVRRRADGGRHQLAAGDQTADHRGGVAADLFEDHDPAPGLTGRQRRSRLAHRIQRVGHPRDPARTLLLVDEFS